MKFNSFIFEDILVVGQINLKAERKFKLFRNYEVKVFSGNDFLFSFYTVTKYLNQKIFPGENKVGFNIDIRNQSEVIYDHDIYNIKVERFYPFKKKYGELFINGEKVGELFSKGKIMRFTLDFVPNESLIMNSEKYLKIAFLILINIADLDGSE
jgi:hypothetical protein